MVVAVAIRDQADLQTERDRQLTTTGARFDFIDTPEKIHLTLFHQKCWHYHFSLLKKVKPSAGRKMVKL